MRWETQTDRVRMRASTGATGFGHLRPAGQPNASSGGTRTSTADSGADRAGLID